MDIRHVGPLVRLPLYLEQANQYNLWRKIPALLTLQPEHVLTKNVLGEGRIGEEPAAETQYLTSLTTKNHRTENVSTNS